MFRGGVAGPGVSAFGNTGVWATGWGGEALGLVALEGRQAPGVGSGVVFDELESHFPVHVGAGGDVMLHAPLKGDGVTGWNRWGLWCGRYPADSGLEGAFSMVVREGDRAPGFHPLSVFEEVWPCGVTADGSAIFSASIRKEHDSVGEQTLWIRERMGRCG